MITPISQLIRDLFSRSSRSLIPTAIPPLLSVLLQMKNSRPRLFHIDFLCMVQIQHRMSLLLNTLD